MIKAVIFDVDGTLVDSVDQHAAAFQEAFRSHGKEIDFHQIRSQIGKGLDNLLPIFLSPGEISSFGKELGELKSRIFMSRYFPHVKGFPKVRELCEHILADGKHIALASSAGEKELEKLKERARISDLILDQSSAENVERSKPAPDVFEAALRKLGNVTAGEVICVGDTPYDIEGAAKAGMQTIGLRSGGFPESSLAGAIQIFKDPEDLLIHYAESAIAEG